jgi:hypothetical protein
MFSVVGIAYRHTQLHALRSPRQRIVLPFGRHATTGARMYELLVSTCTSTASAAPLARHHAVLCGVSDVEEGAAV